MRKQVFIVYGPTASGKSALVEQLAQAHPITIINMDAVQVYKDFNIGAAKPAAHTRNQYPHALFDIVTLPAPFSVAQYLSVLDEAIHTAFSEKRIPVLVGGTMLYLNAIMQGGLVTTPAIPTEIQNTIDQILNSLTQAQKYAALLYVDPIWAKRIHAHDQQRTHRGLSLYLALQKPGSTYYQADPNPLYDTVLIAVKPSCRKWLHQQIEQRVRAMVDAGLVDEVNQLVQSHQDHLDHFMFRSIGYRQVIEWANQDQSIEDLITMITIATRQFAKRQITWMHKFNPDICFDPCKNESISELLSAKSYGICRQ